MPLQLSWVPLTRSESERPKLPTSATTNVDAPLTREASQTLPNDRCTSLVYPGYAMLRAFALQDMIRAPVVNRLGQKNPD